MNVVRVLLEEFDQVTIDIGYQGEKNHNKVIICCPVMFRNYPDAVASMVVKPQQGDLYPVSLTRVGNDLTWDVSEADVAITGTSDLQLTFTDGSGDTAEIIKTVYGSCSSKASLMANGEAPDPVQSWLDEAGTALSTFETEIGDIRKITTATDADEGKALSPKTVVNGKVTEWEYVDLADPEDIKEAVDEWLDDHPEATTTVEDGAITEAKLNDSLKGDLAWQDDVDELKSAITQEKAPVILDTASGEIVTVPDGADGMKVETLTVAIEPIQDLHGQANPYPAGGGKNLASSVTYSSVTSQYMGIIVADYKVESGKTYIFSFDTPNSGIEITRGNPSDMGFSSLTPYSFTCDGTRKSFYGVANTTASITGIAVVKRGSETSTTASGLMSNFMVEEVASGTTTPTPYAPYSNICSISGWTEANVSRTGVNVWDEETQVGYWNSTTGVYVYFEGQLCSKNYISVKPNTTYRNYKEATTNQGELIFFDADKGFISSKLPSAWINKEFTTPDNCYFMQFNLGASYGATYNHDISINYPSTDTQYHAYSGSTAEYEFPQEAKPVYVGNLTVNSDGTGELVATHKMWTTDGNTSWTIVDEGTADVSFNSQSGYDFDVKTADDDGYSNYFKYRYSFSTSGTVMAYSNRININKGSGFTTVAELQAAFAQTPLQVLYPLATPVTYQLTNQQVIALLKGNNIWADTGNTSIDYPADTKSYVDNAIPTVPVQDVQVNGTSVLNQGVANVPVASSDVAGVIKTSGNLGTNVLNGILFLAKATDANIKAGSNQYQPIVPYNQHTSVFYALAKLAGADMASSSNAVGTYTADALVKIQKMLGIYEAPWELIREDTVTNATEADIDITVDGNGNPFELTDAIVMFETPKQDTDSSFGGSGIIRFYHGNNYMETYPGAYTQAANTSARGVSSFFERKSGGLIITKYRVQTSTTNGGNLAQQFYANFEGSGNPITIDSSFVVDKITIHRVTGTGHYKIYGKRKWN